MLGQHTAPVRCVEFNAEMNTIVTGSWDNTVKLWDGRSSAKCNGSFPQPDKVIENVFRTDLKFLSVSSYLQVYSMSSCGHRLIVGTAGRKVLIWDLRQMGQPEQKRDSSLKYQTRCLKAFPNRQGFVLSSIEGFNPFWCWMININQLLTYL